MTARNSLGWLRAVFRFRISRDDPRRGVSPNEATLSNKTDDVLSEIVAQFGTGESSLLPDTASLSVPK